MGGVIVVFGETGILPAIYKARKRKSLATKTKTEDTMTTNTNTTTATKIEAGYETSTFALGAGMTMAALVGIWGFACLTSAMISIGPLNVVKGYLTAVIG